MHKLPLPGSLVLAAIATAGCSSALPTTPTTFSSSPAVALSLSPPVLVAQPAGQSACPSVAPFDVPFRLLISTTDLGFSVTNITARFVDTNGVSMPQVTLPMEQVTLPAPVPTTQFGSALAASREVPLSLGIGCGTGHAGTLTLIVATMDGRGLPGSAQLVASVR